MFLRKVKRGIPILADDHNSIVKYLRRFGPKASGTLQGIAGGLGSSLYNPRIRRTNGVVHIPVAGDYTDCRYFVRLSSCDNAAGDETVVISFSDPADDDLLVTATNIAELISDSHLVTDNTPVVLYWEWDIQSPKIRRYYFSSISATAILRFGVPTGAYAAGVTITLDPCDIDGVDNGTANVVVQAGWALPANTTIPVTAIIPFLLAADDDYYVVGQPREVMTNIRYDVVTHKLQKKVRYDWGVFTTTESTAWVDVTTAVDCTS